MAVDRTGQHTLLDGMYRYPTMADIWDTEYTSVNACKTVTQKFKFNRYK